MDSFLEELEKIAAVAAAAKPKKRKGLSTGGKVLGTAGTSAYTAVVGGTLGGLGARAFAGKINPSNAPIGYDVIPKLQESLSHTQAFDAGNWRSSMMIPKGGTMPKSLRGLEEAQYLQAGIPKDVVEKSLKGGSVVAPLTHSPEFLAHELGHASLRDPKKSNFLLRSLMKTRAAGIPLGLLAGSAMAMQDPDSTAVKLAPLATAAGFAPTMIDEGLATRRGLKALKDTGSYTSSARKLMRGNLLKALGTYGSLAAGVTLPIGLISYLRSRKNDDATK
jgi:hypothetical protein